MSLEQPAWFADLDAWWLPAAGEDVVARVRPLGFDSQRRLHVECGSRAWTTQMRLVADSLAKRVNECLPDYDVTGLIIHPYARRLPPVVEERWQELLGEDLGTQIIPLMMSRQGQELSTMALSAQARDRFHDMIPEVLERVRRLLGPDSALVEVRDPFLYPVTVVVTASDDWDNRDIIERALLDTWHDVTQVFGPEHLLSFEHAGYSQADRFVHEWAAHHVPSPEDLLPHVRTHDEEERRTREALLISRKPDLCLAFVTDPDQPTRMADAAREASIPVRAITRDTTAGA
ncbi:DciA family protein [Streptomyces decoyicus]|uniref:DciA family protein n=1 Tax=Streptomyces decoyicus TaxID=249567 RepID=UPI0033FC5D5C